MKKIILIIVFLLLPMSVFAHDMVLSWDEDVSADGYGVRQSIDNGVTWTNEVDVGSVLATIYVVPDTGLVLVQIGAYNSLGTTWRTDAGLFYNGDWKLLTVTGLGVE